MIAMIAITMRSSMRVKILEFSEFSLAMNVSPSEVARMFSFSFFSFFILCFSE